MKSKSKIDEIRGWLAKSEDKIGQTPGQDLNLRPRSPNLSLGLAKLKFKVGKLFLKWLILSK